MASAFVALAYVQRLPGALFGLDQINVMLALYLAVGPSGDAFSLDRWLKRRKAGAVLPVRQSWTANLAIRLIQIHMCVIYLFAGMAKLTGTAWWDGTALWMAFGNMEYQSMDMTWMADYPLLINVMTHVTVFWELSYWALVWPRLTRPVVHAAGHSAAHGHRHLPGHDHLRPGHADRQPGVCFAGAGTSTDAEAGTPPGWHGRGACRFRCHVRQAQPRVAPLDRIAPLGATPPRRKFVCCTACARTVRFLALVFLGRP